MASAAELYHAYLERIEREYPPAFGDLAWLIHELLPQRDLGQAITRAEAVFADFALERFARPRPARNEAPRPCDVLVVLQPERSDYVQLFTPVIAELEARGASVAVLVAPGSSLGSADFLGAQVFSQLAGASRTAYVRARSAYHRLLGHLPRLVAQLDLNRVQARAVKLLLQSHCWHAELVGSVLRTSAPRAILGLHFLSTPGLLGGIRLYRAKVSPLPVFLLQHGVFSHTWPTHDFRGADRVLLWGRESERELSAFPGVAPASSVVGNPRLSAVIDAAARRRPKVVDSGTHASGRSTQVLVIGTNGDPVRERQAVQLVCEALPASEGLEIVFRPHPSQPASVYTEAIAAGRLASVRVRGEGDVHQAVADADVVLGTESTVLPECALLGTPAVQLLSESSPMSWRGRGMLGASEPSALRALVHSLVGDPEFLSATLYTERELARAVVGNPDGAARRSADAILAACGLPWGSVA